MKKFNVTGICVPSKHYMVDISGKIAQIKKLIDNSYYFTINKARQYGKTTTLLHLERAVYNDYIVASISFEGIGDETFATQEKFCKAFVDQIYDAILRPEKIFH